MNACVGYHGKGSVYNHFSSLNSPDCDIGTDTISYIRPNNTS